MVTTNSKLGFVEVCAWDRIDQNILFAYCEGHSFFWNVFFGWRRTKFDDELKKDFMYFLIPSRHYETLKKFAIDTRRSH